MPKQLNLSLPSIFEKIAKFSFHDKTENIIGLQVADLIALPIGRNYLNKKQIYNYSTIERKFKTRKGKFKGIDLIKRVSTASQ